MKISNHLYVSESLNKKQKRIIRKITRNQKIFPLFCITNPTNEQNSLDIYCYGELFQKTYNRYYDLTVYGIAKTREEAYYLVADMLQDCISTRGDCDLRKYLHM